MMLPHSKKLEAPLSVKCCCLFVIFAGPDANFIVSEASKLIEGCVDEFCTDVLTLGIGTNPDGNDFCLRQFPFGKISRLKSFGPANCF